MSKPFFQLLSFILNHKLIKILVCFCWSDFNVNSTMLEFHNVGILGPADYQLCSIIVTVNFRIGNPLSFDIEFFFVLKK